MPSRLAGQVYSADQAGVNDLRPKGQTGWPRDKKMGKERWFGKLGEGRERKGEKDGRGRGMRGR